MENYVENIESNLINFDIDLNESDNERRYLF